MNDSPCAPQISLLSALRWKIKKKSLNESEGFWKVLLEYDKSYPKVLIFRKGNIDLGKIAQPQSEKKYIFPRFQIYLVEKGSSKRRGDFSVSHGFYILFVYRLTTKTKFS